MTMHTVWVIFKKDARRLWWLAALAVALLAVLVHQEAYRADYYADAVESWVDLVLPLVWACLIAQAMHGEVMLGDREFWMTRPYRRAPLLLSKVLFAVVFVHVPSFLGDVAMVSLRGLSPAAALPHLLAMQLMLAGAVTLPSMALAAVVRNLVQFVLIAVLVPVVVLSLYRPAQSEWGYGQGWWVLTQDDPLRTFATVLIMAATGLAVLFLQGLARRGWWARGIGAAGLVAASLLLLLTPSAYTLGRTGPAQHDIRVLLNVDWDAAQKRRMAPNGTTRRLVLGEFRNFAIPLSVSGLPENTMFRAMPTRCDLTAANGLHFRDEIQPQRNVPRNFFSLLALQSPGAGVLRVNMARKGYDSIGESPVTIKGQAVVQFFSFGTPTRLPESGGSVPGLGRCLGIAQDNPLGASYYKVECESADGSPPDATIKLIWPGHGREWSVIASGGGGWLQPRQPWLPPVDRRQASFTVSDFPVNESVLRWQIPREAMTDLQVQVTPVHAMGYVVVEYQFSNIRLGDFPPNQ